MEAVEWRSHIGAELQRLEVQIDRLPSGAYRLANRHGYLLTTDIRNVTDSDLDTFTPKQMNRTTLRA